MSTVDIVSVGISTIIWRTGFRTNFGTLSLPAPPKGANEIMALRSKRADANVAFELSDASYKGIYA
jgi:hypothetical protein